MAMGLSTSPAEVACLEQSSASKSVLRAVAGRGSAAWCGEAATGGAALMHWHADQLSKRRCFTGWQITAGLLVDQPVTTGRAVWPVCLHSGM
jgi:hypothetical protein